jgi:hypothetical protein
MINLRRLDVIRFFAVSALLMISAAPSLAQQRRRSPRRWPRPSASTYSGK